MPRLMGFYGNGLVISFISVGGCNVTILKMILFMDAVIHSLATAIGISIDVDLVTHHPPTVFGLVNSVGLCWIRCPLLVAEVLTAASCLMHSYTIVVWRGISVFSLIEYFCLTKSSRFEGVMLDDPIF